VAQLALVGRIVKNTFHSHVDAFLSLVSLVIIKRLNAMQNFRCKAGALEMFVGRGGVQ